MAMHSVTALIEMANVYYWNEWRRCHHIGDMDYAEWPAELSEQNRWALKEALTDWPDDQIRQVVIKVLRNQLNRWFELGEPRSHNGWVRAENTLEEV